MPSLGRMIGIGLAAVALLPGGAAPGVQAQGEQDIAGYMARGNSDLAGAPSDPAPPDREELAAAEDCGRWQASVSMVGDGHMAMNARACSAGDGPAADIQILCGDGAELYIRVGLEIPASAGDYTGLAQDFLFAANGAERPVPMVYEALDGAFTTSLGADDPLIEMIRSGLALRISDPLGKLPDHRLPLAGSRRAIDRLMAACR